MHAQPSPAVDDIWTTRRLLAWITQAFVKAGLDAPRLSAELLIAHVIGCDRLRLYMETDRPATPLERDTLRGLVGRALKNEPVQYLVGEGWFFGLPFRVDRRVLVPRPSTETLVEHVLQTCRSEPGFGGTAGDGLTIIDACTGSGCIIVTLLKHLKNARGAATDISAEALVVAGDNARRHGVETRLELREGDLFAPLADHPLGRQADIITSNPPYIPDGEWADVPVNVRDYEPERALRGGPDGLSVVSRVLGEAPDLLRPGGMLLVEIASSTAGACRERAENDARLHDVRLLHDHEALPRVLLARRV